VDSDLSEGAHLLDRYVSSAGGSDEMLTVCQRDFSSSCGWISVKFGNRFVFILQTVC